MQKCKLILILVRWGIVMSVIYAATGEDLLELGCSNKAPCRQFEHTGITADCIENSCVCHTREGFVVQCSPQNSNKNNIIGGMCPCEQPNAECHVDQNVCYCVSEYMPSLDLRRCLKRSVTLGGACEMHEQCESHDAFAYCHQRICQCHIGYMQRENICLASLGPRIVFQNCSNNNDCEAKYGAMSMCEEKTTLTGQAQCVCQKGYVSASDGLRCLPAAGFNESCLVHAQCQIELGAGGRCTKNICNCNAEMYEERQIVMEDNSRKIMCFTRPRLATYCVSDDDCHEATYPDVDIEHRMYCQFGQCNCKEGYVATPERYCTSSAPTIISFNIITLLLVFLFL